MILSTPTRRSEIAAGLRASLAAGLGMFPLGIAFGLLVVQAGLPWWMAPALSVAAFAGSLELLLIGMLTSGASLVAIAATTFFVNFRHVFYALSFPLASVRGAVARAYSVYGLIDEAYAVTAASPTGWTGPRLVAMQLAFQAYWVGGGLVGVAVAAALPLRIEGLEFALCALFVTLTLDACRTRRQVPSVLLAAASFSVAVVATPDAVVFVALTVFAASLLVRFFATKLMARVSGRRAEMES
ncbi:AzlC family ABC transporter permease [Agromyces cavernae]|uniref:AzlC family ABC transporter permease n=1 Tax=Agromyces cavernae TaxID=2898659 RepID=UPI0027155A0E|nr:AzlC family ABC transporter permease [Agromyces cavernae]